MLTEERFLAQQGALARARLRSTIGTWRDETMAALDVRAAIRRRPWWSLAGAAIGGFVTGAVLGRRRQPRTGPIAPAADHGVFGNVSHRAYRVVRSALDVLALVGLRGPAPVAKAPPGPAPHDAGTDDAADD
jgi:hypothetical protein